MKPIVKKCRVCGKLYKVGRTGLGDGTCDECAHVQRDGNGGAWYSWEKKQELYSIETGKVTTVTREEAFK